MTTIMLIFSASFAITLLAVMLLGVRILFVRNGEFPNIHIGSCKPMKDKGIKCATTQDRESRKTTKKIDINKIINEIDY